MKKVILLTLLITIPNIAFAESGDWKWALDIIDGVVTIGATIMAMAGIVIGWLLSPDWTNGTLFGMQNIMKELWILISNVVYFVFAFLLIAIAFMNIIGRGGDNFALKTALPKFIVGVLIVPFTWFIVQFVVSASSVLTASVMQLPSSIFPTQYEDSFFDTKSIPKHCTLDLNKITSESSSEAGFFTCKDGENDKVSIKDISEKSPYGVISVYSYDLLGFQNIAKVWKQQLESGTLSDNVSLILFQLFKVIFFVVYVVLLVAMFFALFVRIVRLWLFMIFSPMFGLMFYFGSAGESLKKFNFKQFISLALVPVYVAAALSFGMFFLKAVQQGIEKPVTSGTMEIQTSDDKKVSTISTQSGGKEIKLVTVKGELFDWKQSPLPGGSMGNPLGVIGDLIINIITLAVIWISVMAALKSSEITEEVIKPMADFGSNIGGFMKKLPQYTPIPGLGLDMKGLSHLSSQPQSILGQLSERKTSKYKSVINKKMGGDFDYGGYDTITERLEGGALGKDDIDKTLRELAPFIAKYGMKDPRVEKLMKAMKEALDKDEGLSKNVGEEYGIDHDFSDKDNFYKLLSGGNKVTFNSMKTGAFKSGDNGFEFRGGEGATVQSKNRQHGDGIEVDGNNGVFNIAFGSQTSRLVVQNHEVFKDLSKDDLSTFENKFEGEDIKVLKQMFSDDDMSPEFAKDLIKEMITGLSPDIKEGDIDKDTIERIYDFIKSSK